MSALALSLSSYLLAGVWTLVVPVGVLVLVVAWWWLTARQAMR